MDKSKRLQQKEATRKLIIKTAYNVYSENGFSSTTSDIAKQAQISHGTIFTHFPTLNDLLVCLLQEFGHAVGLRLHELAEGSQNISDVLWAHLNALEEYEGFYTRIVSETSLLPEQAKNTLIMIQSVISLHLNKVAEREMIQGRIKKLPMHMIFNMWIGLVHYYLQNNDLFAPDSSVLKHKGNELINSFLELIKV